MDKAQLSMLLQLVRDARTTNYATGIIDCPIIGQLRLLLDDRKGGGINMEDAEEAGKHHIFDGNNYYNHHKYCRLGAFNELLRVITPSWRSHL
ncbi:hypothetical protein WG66_006329 [Moniliophthora roreri]|nr:hypothetical protein WG66_006329 [Moniliophthora roreri]